MVRIDKPQYLDENRVLETSMLQMYHPIAKRSGKGGNSACATCGQPTYFPSHETVKVKMAREILKHRVGFRWAMFVCIFLGLISVANLVMWFFR